MTAPTLVTGGAGFVGLAIVEHLLARGEAVTVLDVHAFPPDAAELFARLPGKLRVVTGSVLDAKALAAAAEGASSIIHAATVTPDAKREVVDPVTVNECNFNGTLAVLELVRRTGQPLLHLSTSGVYGEVQNRPGFRDPLVGEDVLPDPRSLYAVSKTAAEQTVLRYVTLFGITAHVARVGVCWGPWEHDTGMRHVFSAPLQLLRRAHAGQEAVIGRESIKDWSYSRDVAKGVVMLRDARANLKSRVFNVSGDSDWPVTAFADHLKAAFPGFRWRLATAPDASDVNVTLSKASDRQGLDIARLRAETGYAPSFGREQAFADYVAWSRQTTCWR
jgi:UDP-glucuronate 4-epimerase